MNPSNIRFLKVNSITEITDPIPNAIIFERTTTGRVRIYVTDKLGGLHESTNDFSLADLQAFVEDRLVEATQPVEYTQAFVSDHWVIPHTFNYSPNVVTTNGGEVIEGEISHEFRVVHIRWWEPISGVATLT